LVIFTSDNGPWLSYGDHAGSARPLREGKMTTFEGGVREPCLGRWPGKIPAGTICREPVMTIDFLPTFAHLAAAKLPAHKIDGLDIWPLLSGKKGARSPHEALFFYWNRELQAVRSGKWKLHFPHDYRTPKKSGSGGKPGKIVTRKIGLALYDLDRDVGETTNVGAEHPDVVKRLKTLADMIRADLGDSATKQKGTGVRPAGKIRDRD
jgi:arylsulfatase A